MPKAGTIVIRHGAGRLSFLHPSPAHRLSFQIDSSPTLARPGNYYAKASAGVGRHAFASKFRIVADSLSTSYEAVQCEDRRSDQGEGGEIDGRDDVVLSVGHSFVVVFSIRRLTRLLRSLLDRAMDLFTVCNVPLFCDLARESATANLQSSSESLFMLSQRLLALTRSVRSVQRAITAIEQINYEKNRCKERCSTK